jgi:hypothetical protein
LSKVLPLLETVSFGSGYKVTLLQSVSTAVPGDFVYIQLQ